MEFYDLLLDIAVCWPSDLSVSIYDVQDGIQVQYKSVDYHKKIIHYESELQNNRALRSAWNPGSRIRLTEECVTRRQTGKGVFYVLNNVNGCHKFGLFATNFIEVHNDAAKWQV